MRLSKLSTTTILDLEFYLVELRNILDIYVSEQAQYSLYLCLYKSSYLEWKTFKVIRPILKQAIDKELNKTQSLSFAVHADRLGLRTEKDNMFLVGNQFRLAFVNKQLKQVQRTLVKRNLQNGY